MIRLVLVRLSGIEDESWRRPVGRGSVTEFEIQNGTIRLAEPPVAVGSADDGTVQG
jgi:broad specificity phosphatase PhoE